MLDWNSQFIEIRDMNGNACGSDSLEGSKGLPGERVREFSKSRCHGENWSDGGGQQRV